MKVAFRRSVLLLACVLAGCNGLSDLVSGKKYRGPRPAAEGISNEVAIVRALEAVPGYIVLLLDRNRYVQVGDPHNVNRVVQVGSGATMLDTMAALNLSPGDSVLISTRYQGYTNVIGIRSVPNWPGHDAYEYPVGVHVVTAIARAGS